MICRLHALPPLCHEAGQQCLLDLFDALDVLEVGSLDLELKALRDGATSTLDVSVERLEKRWPALEGESEGVTAARRERSALEGSKCCGRLVAAAITTAARIVEVDCRGVALGEAASDVAAAARRHLSLRKLNGVSHRRAADASSQFRAAAHWGRRGFGVGSRFGAVAARAREFGSAGLFSWAGRHRGDFTRALQGGARETRRGAT